MATAEALLTAGEYFLLPDNGQPTELVRGRVIPMNVPAPRHGKICLRIGHYLLQYLDDHDVGQAMSNDSGVVTEHDPDSVRGPDISYYSYCRLPKGPLPKGYLPVVPELVFEVRSPDDGWAEIHAKVAEYHGAGVLVACVLDPETQTLTVYRTDQPPHRLSADEDLVLPDLLAHFRVQVRRFFD